MENVDYSKLSKIVNKAITKKFVQGAVFSITKGDEASVWSGSAGNLSTDSKYYIASINKLIVSAIILKLISESRLSFEDTLEKYLPFDLLNGLHVYKGVDYSKDITILHLLSQTSGLPCYLSDKDENGVAIIKELEAGIDQAWPTSKVIERTKNLTPHFPPGQGKKAKYVDTNHQLLNVVIEKILNKPLVDILNQLFFDLNMNHTYVCEDVKDRSYVLPYYKNETRDISKFVTSTNNDIISTAQDQLIFLRAFFNGYFYPKEKLESLQQFKSIFFPFQYGIGIQKFYTPWILSPFKSIPDMIGHCGSTGAVAFYIPEIDVYVTGTTNQQANPSAAFQTIMRMIDVVS